MKFLIAGLGSIGRRHLRNLIQLGQHDIVLLRSNLSTLPNEELAEFPTFTNIEDALSCNPDAVIISNPTALHMQVALPAARVGCALFVEKPLAILPDDLNEIQDILEEEKTAFFTGFQFRFNPGLKKIVDLIQQSDLGRPLSFVCKYADYLPGWHPWEDYRISYAARRELGGGVVLTLCHPLDYLRWLFGEVASLFAFSGKNSDLEIDVEDNAEILMKFKTGITGSLHLDYYRQPPAHDLEITFTNGVVRWDHQKSDVLVLKPDVPDIIYPSPAGYNRNDMYLEEMRSFIHLIEEGGQPDCGFDDGRKALELALAVRQSARYNQPCVFN